MDNREREEYERHEREIEERRWAILECIAECQRRGRESRGLEKGQINATKSETYNKKD